MIVPTSSSSTIAVTLSIQEMLESRNKYVFCMNLLPFYSTTYPNLKGL